MTRTAGDVGLWAYPWDLADVGWDSSLPSIAELGITTLRVAASYHSVQGYFPHNPKRPVLRADAAVYFSPDASLYAATSLRPIPSPLLPEIGELGDLVRRARAEGLRTVAWTVCLHNSRLASEHPDAAQLDAFHRRHPAALCPSNPDVRAYVVALVRDLVQNHGVDGIELEAAHFSSWQHHAHRKVAAPPDPLRDLLLSLCFCASCAIAAEAAGIDLGQVAADARRAVTFRPEPTTDRGGADRDASLTAFLRVRREAVTKLLHAVHGAAGATPIFYFGPTDDEVTGIDWPAAERMADVLELPAYVASPERVRAIVRRRVETSGLPASRWTLGLSAGYPEVSARQHLLDLVEAALDQGVAGLSFYNYGLVPSTHLAWVHDAAARARAPLGVLG
jgi:hypothetical protein